MPHCSNSCLTNLMAPQPTCLQANLPDARPLINVCDRFDMVGDLTLYL